MRIGIIVGSTRQNRLGRTVGEWVLSGAKDRQGADYELVDLADFHLPLLSSPVPPGALDKQYEGAAVQEWSKAIDGLDGFVFVTPEYNHSVPGAMKNAVDQLGSEWSRKALGIVAYGAGGGFRVTEAWRLVMANFDVYDIRAAVNLDIMTEVGEDGLQLHERRAGELDALLTSLEAATTAMATLR